MAFAVLDGVRCIEYCQLAAGPYCGRLLANWGAEVIKIEEPSVGDQARRTGPFLRDIPNEETATLFLYLNTNKLGITLNLKSFHGRNILHQLLKEADIFFHDVPPLQAAELGLDYTALQGVNAQLIVTAISPFGQTGPWRDYKAHPLNVSNAGGQAYLLSGGKEYTERPPIKAGGFLEECDAGMAGAIGTLAALYVRPFIGRGQLVDISKQETLIAINRTDIDKYPDQGVVESRSTRRRRPGSMLRCRDGYVETTPNLENQWKGLTDVLGNPQWAKDDRFSKRSLRAENAEELNPLLEEWTQHHDRAYVVEHLQKSGCPAGAVHDPAEVMQQAPLRERGFFTEIEHSRAGKLTYATGPYQFSKARVEADRPAPLLGEHNEEIYRHRLGYCKEELVMMRRGGII